MSVRVRTRVRVSTQFWIANIRTGVPFLPSLEDVTITASSAMEKPVRIFAFQNCVDTRTRVRTRTLIQNYTNKYMYIHIHIHACTLFWIGFSIMMSTFHFIPSFSFLPRLISVSHLLSFLLFLLPYFLPYFLYFLSLQTFSLIFFSFLLPLFCTSTENSCQEEEFEDAWPNVSIAYWSYRPLLYFEKKRWRNISSTSTKGCWRGRRRVWLFVIVL